MESTPRPAARAGQRRALTRLETGKLVGADRVLAVLKSLAEYCDGVGLDELTRAVDSPKPTVHRALQSLRRSGLATQDERGRYVLSEEFLRLAFAHHEGRPEHVRVRPTLELLARRFGETVHYAALDGREVIYRAKVDAPAGAVRLTSTIGGRNPAHCTAVGKALLAHLLPTKAAVVEWVGDRELIARTPHSRTSAAALHRELSRVRQDGYAIDRQENEIGVVCLAVPVFLTSPTSPSGAVSISALAYRTPMEDLVAALDEIRAIVAPLMLRA